MAIVAALTTATKNTKQQAIERVFNATDITTSKMVDALREWNRLYYGREVAKESDPSQRIPVAIVSKLSRTVFSEFTADSNNPFFKKVIDGLETSRKRAVQQALIGGEILLKPVMANDDIHFTIIDRQSYLIFGRDRKGNITDIGTSETTATGGFFYTLFERRTVDEGGYLTIQNKLYRSKGREDIGNQVPLGSLPQYAALEESATYTKPIGSIGLVRVRTPMENCVDGSNDGVSVYEPAAGLIRLININEAQISGEFEHGESRIIVSNDMMEVDEKGKRAFRDHIFSGIPESPEDVGVKIFSPAFREQSFLARKAEYLRNVESLIGLKRGILSEVEATERTATEITSSAGDYNLTIIDFQQMWETAIMEAARLCGILGQLYNVRGAQEPTENDIIISFGNGILYDEDKVWEQYKDMVARGLLKPEIAVAWYFDLPWDTDADIAEIRRKYMPELEDLTHVKS